MRWNSHREAIGCRLSAAGWQIGSTSPLLALVCVLLLTATAAEEKRLSVYTPQGAYAVGVVEHEGKDYVGLMELLRPLGEVSAKRDGDKWKLRFQAAGRGEVEAEFRAGKAKAKVRGKSVELGAPFWLEGERGLAPVAGLGEVVTKMLPPPLEFHGNARRLFVGGVGTQFTAELQKGAPPRLLLHFSAPVSPAVSQEPGRLRLVFTRDPVTAPPASQQFEDKVITAASYSESNGAGELTVTGTAPLMASFSEGGRTITVAPAPQAQAPTPAPPPSAPPATPETGQPPAQPATSTGPAPAAAGPRYLVVIDPGHGGEERGALLSASLAEKEVTLAWARKLRAALEKQGIAATLLRDGDVALTLEQRAAAANGVRAAVFVTLHAASNGHGVRVYTARLKPSPARPGEFLPWETAQAAFLEASRGVAAKVAEELGKRQIPVGAAPVFLRPLNNVAGPAIAIEVAPPGSEVEGLNSALYQQSVCSAIAAGIAAAREGAH